MSHNSTFSRKDYAMRLLRKILKKHRRRTFNTFQEKNIDGFLIRIISDKYLSEELVDIIAAVAYSGFIREMSFEEISCNILLYCQVPNSIVIDMIDHGMEIKV